VTANFKPNILHAFDTHALFFARLVAHQTHNPLFYTKCGGPNPRVFHPRAPNIIAFSLENQAYFKNHRKFRSSQILLLPNRVHPHVHQDANRIASLRAMLDPARSVFLRIARLTPLHERSIGQSIRLVNQLSADGYAVQLAIVGHVYDSIVLQRLRVHAGSHVHFFTDAAYTKNASELIDAGDFVIGSGRGFMEAAARSKVLLVSQADCRFPALITEDTFQPAFACNLSGRARLTSDESANYKAIVAVVTNPATRRQYEVFARRLFDRYFNIETVLPTYHTLYEQAVWRRDPHLLDLLAQGLFLLRAHLRIHPENGSANE